MLELQRDRLAGESVGVFLGISSIDHWQQVLARSPDTIDAYLATGNTHSVAAGRLSYLLGVSGPSLAIGHGLLFFFGVSTSGLSKFAPAGMRSGFGRRG